MEVIQEVAPRPQDEAARSTVKLRRVMESRVQVRKGQPDEVHTYVREDM